MPKNKAISAIIIEPNVNSIMRSWNRSAYVTYMLSPSLHKRGTKKENGFTLSVIDQEEREPPTVMVCPHSSYQNQQIPSRNSFLAAARGYICKSKATTDDFSSRWLIVCSAVKCLAGRILFIQEKMVCCNTAATSNPVTRKTISRINAHTGKPFQAIRMSWLLMVA